MPYQLLESFERLFQGSTYLHRQSNLGDLVAMRFYEDLYALGRSPKFVKRVDEARAVLNAQNKQRGVKARRGDGSFGEIVPGWKAIRDEGFAVQRGAIATIELGIEVKVLAKAMLKQVDRVINDLNTQAGHFRAKRGNPICVAIVGINHATQYTSYEGDRAWPTDGRKYKHPVEEAKPAEVRLQERAAATFDEFLVLRFAASNVAPFPFQWIDAKNTELDYGTALVRVSRQYEQRF